MLKSIRCLREYQFHQIHPTQDSHYKKTLQDLRSTLLHRALLDNQEVMLISTKLQSDELNRRYVLTV
jgi:hypothetical protein